jgi:hypothetical protein
MVSGNETNRSSVLGKGVNNNSDLLDVHGKTIYQPGAKLEGVDELDDAKDEEVRQLPNGL